MAYRDPEKKREYDRLRGIRRREYFREYRRNHPKVNPYKSYGGSVGYCGEELGLKVLVGSRRIHRPCDLDWNGKLVDVKTARPTVTTNGGTKRWKFLLSRQKLHASLYLLIRKDENDKVIDIYLIPNVGKSNLSFCDNTKYKYAQFLLSL